MKPILQYIKNVINYQKTNICTQGTSSSRDPVISVAITFCHFLHWYLIRLLGMDLIPRYCYTILYIRFWYINVHYIDLNKNITIQDRLHRAVYWPMRNTTIGIQCIASEVRKSYYDSHEKKTIYLNTIVQIYINIVTEVRTQDVKSNVYAHLSIF